MAVGTRSDHPDLPPVNSGDIRLLFGLTLALAIITTVFVFGRLIIRRFYIGKIEIDDWILGVAWIVLMAYTGTQLGSVQINYELANDLVQRVWNPATISLKLRLDYVLMILYYVCVYLTKLSILCLYLRLCRSETQLRYTSSGGRLRGCTWLTVILITVISIPSVIVSICRCLPIKSIWTVTGDAGDSGCVNQPAFFIATSVLHIFSDIIIAILPIPLVMRLRGPLLYRVGLASILMLGLLATAACAGRLAVLIEANEPNSFFYQFSTSVNTWSYAECSLGMIGAAVPALKPIFRSVCKVLGGSGWSTASCTNPQESDPSRSLPCRVAAEGNRQRINNFHLEDLETDRDMDISSSKCSKYESRTNSSARGSAQTDIEVNLPTPLAVKLRGDIDG